MRKMETEEGVQSQQVGQGQRRAGLQKRTPDRTHLSWGRAVRERGRNRPEKGPVKAESPADPPWRSLRAKLELGFSPLGLTGWAAGGGPARPSTPPRARPGVGTRVRPAPRGPGAGTARPSGGTDAAGCFSSGL